MHASGGAHALERGDDGIHHGRLDGGEYLLAVDGKETYPDPCSRHQPYGVRGPSAVVDPRAFAWTDSAWRGVTLDDLVIYELHVGTFTEEGTFDGVVPRLRGLRELGVTAIELMPVATFPGERGWGYDGLYIYAPHPAYGGPAGLARLVDAAHAEGLGVILDVVYNHVGPGNEALTAFAPYFSSKHHTFWGDAIDYEQRGVREWAIQNAEQWVRDYHVDGLRLDAVHAIFDDTPHHICAELAERVHALEPRALVISEMEVDNWTADRRMGTRRAVGRPLPSRAARRCSPASRTATTPATAPCARSRTTCKGRVTIRAGSSICAQNHDQVGNRALGDRLPPDALRVAAAVTLFSPCTPLLFMGEEYLEERPFQFFTDHIDPAIAEATRAGRRKEFEAFAAFSGEDVPDPQDVETFLRSKLAAREPDPLYRELLELRRSLPRELEVVEADEEAKRLHLRRGSTDLLADFRAKQVEIRR